MIIESKDKKKEETIRGMVGTDNTPEINTPVSKEAVVAEAAEVVVEGEEAEAVEETETMMKTTPMEVPGRIDLAKNIPLLTMIQTTESFMRMM
jgi:hypothetical protein